MLILGIIISMLVPVKASNISLEYSVEPNGNKGAIIKANQTVSATVSDQSLATVETSQNQVVVTAKSGAVGVVDLMLYCGNTQKLVQIPVGYTTFYFNDNTLTVINGKDTTYEITGINKNDEEIVPDYTTDEQGNQVYQNADNYSLNVGIKKKGGTFAFYGSSDDMTITVKKEATGDSNLLLEGLNLKSSFTSPITVKKDSTAKVYVNCLSGYTNTLTDATLNNSDIYGDTASGGNGTNASYAESAVIKGKSHSDITLCGSGILNLDCKSKNAIKVGEFGNLTIKDLTLNIQSAKHGISCDNLLNIQSGTLNVNALEDGIRTDPDSVDEELGKLGKINIENGKITIKSGLDAIQSMQDIVISGGEFDITTLGGYNDKTFNSKTMSCKGIKASADTDSTDKSTNNIVISGGTFKLNCADDAIHSDAFVDIKGGTFEIKTGDDGIHASTTLDIGIKGDNNENINIDVINSYEGLEAGTVNISSGNISMITSDDGTNAAGGADSSGGGGFNPGGGHGWSRPGAGNPPSGNTSSYSLNIYGGNIYVNATGDGLDSNGSLTLSGGNIIVWGQQSGGDNEPLDSDGALTIKGATVFAAGSSRMITTPQNSQPYITSKTSITSGKTINVKYNNSTVFNTQAIKTVNYVLYSSPEMSSTSGWSIVADNSEVITTTKPTTVTTTTTTITSTTTVNSVEKGDVDRNGVVNSLDVKTLLNIITANGKADSSTCDMNNDGIVNVLDIQQLLSKLLG